MLLYGIILLAGILISLGLNIAMVVPQGIWFGDVVLWLFLAILICGFSSLAICLFTRMLPREHFDPQRKRWHTFKFEEKLQRLLRVKKWKDKIPELGSLSGFEKKKIEDPNKPKYLYKFLTENCLADSLHFFSVFAGLLTFVFLPSHFILTIALPVFITNGVMHTMSWMVQRFLRPKMLKMYERLLRLQKQKVEETEEMEENLVNVH